MYCTKDDQKKEKKKKNDEATGEKRMRGPLHAHIMCSCVNNYLTDFTCGLYRLYNYVIILARDPNRVGVDSSAAGSRSRR